MMAVSRHSCFDFAAAAEAEPEQKKENK